MSTLISGLNEADCRDFVGIESWNTHAFRWCVPDKLATEAQGQPLIWLYRAPWSALDQASNDGNGDVQNRLASWLAQNRSILNMRRQFSDKLLLVNADRVRPADLRARLAGTPIASNASDEPPANSGAPCEGLLGQLFDWSAPQYWDVLEALEGASWLPTGEPLFRNHCNANEEQLNTLLDLLHNPPASQELQALRKASGDTLAGSHQLKQENSELRQESELLLLQLHQVQEELEQYYLKNIELDKIATAREEAANDTRKKLSQSQKSLADTKSMLADAQRKVRTSQLQLQTMQEELRYQQAVIAASAAKPIVPPTKLGRLIPSPARKMLSHSRNRKTHQTQLEAVRKSTWFDKQWYLDTYPDIRAARIDPVEHYLTTGWKENRNPSSGFDTAYYLRSNPDITQSGLNPLWHFIAFGSTEGRLPRKP